MAMTPFLERFPELGARETRSLTVTGRNDLPDGDYGFIELYCNEPHCDCRRVMVFVLRPDTGWKPWATINYGWESLDFYQKWAPSSPPDPVHWQGPFLDPLGTQTHYAPLLLDLFKFLLQSPDYVQRLQNHYQLFRAAVEGSPTHSVGQERHAMVSRRLRRSKAKTPLPGRK
jgi:hypothetical protein